MTQTIPKVIIVFFALVLVFNAAAHAQGASVADILFETGKEYYEKGNYKEALHELNKALLANPEHAQALTYIQIIEIELALTEEEIEEIGVTSEELGRQEALLSALDEAEAALIFEEEVLEFEEEIREPEELVLPFEEEIFPWEEGIIEGEELTIETILAAGPLEELALDEPEEKPALSAKKFFRAPFKKFDNFIEDMNEKIAPVKVSGEYTVSLGAREGELIWKDANGDYNETNWRRVDRNFGINTYDTRVYDKLRLNIDTEKEEGFNFHTNITIDPWSFIGKTDAVNISSPQGERANVQLKYWSANNSIINDTILTLDTGGSIAIPETKVVDGKIPSMTVDNIWGESLTIPELEIHREMWPIRELWVDYNRGDKFFFRFFPIAYQDQALTSDDPLQLSGHQIYWEESPWLDRWQPGILNTGGTSSIGAVDFTKGEWEDDLSFFTRDSSMTRLTSLRGFSMRTQPWETLNIEATVASPKGLWQDYDQFDNIEGATRIKFTPQEKLQLGLVSTFRYGLEESKKDAENRVVGADVLYKFAPDLEVKGQVAYSHDERDLTQEPYDTKKVGNAYKFELQKGKVQEERPEKWDEEALEELAEAEPFDWALRLTYTHMDKGFYPALANYRITRKDPFWGRHIHFKEPYREYYGGLYYPTLTWYDIRPYRIGDSVDIDRDVVGLRLEKAFFDGSMETLFDCRNAHEASGGKYIETISRLETDWQTNENLLIKFLGIYHDLPDTAEDVDPILYDVDTNEFFYNNAIEGGKNPSLKTVSTGFKYSFFDWLSFDFIYERTNDFTVALDDYPRSLLDSSNFTSYTENGLIWRRAYPVLVNQDFFPLPPYPWYNIYKAGLGFEPNEDLKLRLEFTKNDYKYASQTDDNINHLGFTADWDITEKLAVKLSYTYSKSYNLYKQYVLDELEYEKHHNVFVNLDYKMEDKGVFSLQFGEAALMPYSTMFTTSPYPGFLPTLDTAHIVRAYFSRKF